MPSPCWCSSAYPGQIAVDGLGRVYVSGTKVIEAFSGDYEEYRIQSYTADGDLRWQWARSVSGETNLAGGVSVDSAGDIIAGRWQQAPLWRFVQHID
jgi:hypothetical protein